MRYPKQCECGLKVAHLDKHRHGNTHQFRMKVKGWHDRLYDEYYRVTLYHFVKTDQVIREMKEYLGIKD